MKSEQQQKSTECIKEIMEMAFEMDTKKKYSRIYSPTILTQHCEANKNNTQQLIECADTFDFIIEIRNYHLTTNENFFFQTKEIIQMKNASFSRFSVSLNCAFESTRERAHFKTKLH